VICDAAGGDDGAMGVPEEEPALGVMVTVSVWFDVEEYESLAEPGTCLVMVTVLSAMVVVDAPGDETGENVAGTMVEDGKKVVMSIVFLTVTWRVTVDVVSPSELLSQVMLVRGLPAPDRRSCQGDQAGWLVGRAMPEAAAHER
jgi:hypothetical protein